MLNSMELANLLKNNDIPDPLLITPLPNIKRLEKSGSASIDFRLGTWFVAPIHARMSHLEIDSSSFTQNKISRNSYVPFGQSYYLHPGNFVLGITMEWICLPREYSGYLIGKSSWGRRGLIIATATGVQPGFKGCLTLELCNVGEIPIEMKPGMEICQLFLHKITSKIPEISDDSQFIGMRKPVLGKVSLENDKLAKYLADAYSEE